MKKKPASKKRILLAEDDSSIAEVISILLSDKYEVTTPSSYKDVLSLMRDFEFDLVLLDVWLWGKDASKLCRMLKADSGKQQTTVIMLTAKSDAKQLAKSVGADAVIEKPFDIGQLLKTVKGYLNI